MQGSAPLFEVVPAGIFGPLASSNRQHHWALLCRLYEEFFGPDAPLAPPVGFQRREITAAIARRQPVHVFPWQMRWLVAVLNRLPIGLLKRRR